MIVSKKETIFLCKVRYNLKKNKVTKKSYDILNKNRSR